MPPSTERVLTTRELNRAVLERQLLLDRADIPLVEALERVSGLQTQYAPSAYVALWSRLASFRRAALTEALESRDAIQATLMRSTIHIVPAGDFDPYASGTRASRQQGFLRIEKGIDRATMEAVAASLRVHLAKGPRRRTELVDLLAADGYPSRAWGGAGAWVDLVRVPPSGTWERRRADLFGLAEAWLGRASATEAAGHERLVRRYLGGFGPAAAGDIANWAGVPLTSLKSAIDRIDLVRYRDEWDAVLLDLPGLPVPSADTPAPVRFLPTWDATLLVHARRALILPEEHRAKIFHTRNPQSLPTFLVDGAVAGTWRYEAGAVTLDPFVPLDRQIILELEAEAERLAAFHREG